MTQRIKLFHCAAGLFLAGLSTGVCAPTLTKQPADQSVSLGANVQFLVSAKSTNPPVAYQWRFQATNLLAQTNATLNLTNIQRLNVGDYDVIVADATGSVTSRVAALEVDPTFTKILTDPAVQGGGSSFNSAWGDYDDDRYEDLFVTNANGEKNFLYRNNGNGTFTRIAAGAIVADVGDSHPCAWGDFNNDGHLDLFVGNGAGANSERGLS